MRLHATRPALLLAIAFLTPACAPAPQAPAPEPTPTFITAPTGAPSSAAATTAPAPSPAPSIAVWAPTATAPHGKPDIALPPPSFPMLPYAVFDPDGDQPVLDFSQYSEAEVEIYLRFNALAIPANTCTGMAEEYADPTGLLADADRYANCLFDSWRPFAQAHSMDLPRIVVSHCAVSPEVAECGPPESQAFAAMAVDNRVILSVYFGGSADAASQMIAHEIGHVLQFLIAAPGTVAGPQLGAFEPSGVGDRLLRRMELQAECLGTAMFLAGHPRTMEQLVDVGIVGSSDERHWDLESSRFWTAQASTGQVGECNAWVADPSLVAYRE